MIGPQVGDRVSEYILDEKIGAGSFGQVWKAHHHVWKSEQVAIKIPTDSQFVRNLQREGTTIHDLCHPNIVRAIGLDPWADVPYLVMEYVPGCSLAMLIAGAPRGLPVLTVQQIIRGVLLALDHAHGRGVIHHDIKPANILLVGGGIQPTESIRVADVKVTDFGLGRAGEVTATTMLQSGSLLSEEGRSISGTLAYMSPEQREGGATDARSDLYSAGIVLFEMVCGERPSGHEKPSEVRDGLPSWVDHVVSRLYTRRDRRFASAREALSTIELASVPPIVRGAPPPLPPAAAVHVRCPSCSAPIDPWDNFCIMCGTAVVDHPRRCPKCGGFPEADDRFCVFCGAALSAPIG
jgi:serine/threonine-protein kinase